MPVVPQYQIGQVAQRPILQQGINVQASADDMGAAVGRGMQNLAQGVGQVGQAMRAVQELEDVAKAKEADNQFAAWLRERQYGENGYLTLEGQAAVANRTAFEAEVAAKRREFGANLTGGASIAYSRASEARLNDTLDTSIRHAATERKTWFRDASTARLDTFAEDALAAYRDPAKVKKNIAAGVLELRQMGGLEGWDADTLGNKEAEYVSGVHKNIALRIAQTDPAAAMTYYEDHKDALTGPAQTDLENILAPLIIDEQAKSEAARLLETGRVAEMSNGVVSGRRVGEGSMPAIREFLTGKASGNAAGVDGMDTFFAANLAAMLNDAPPELRDALGISSGYRSTETQARLYENSDKSGKWVAKPGGSSHEFGLAADLTFNGERIDPKKHPEAYRWLQENAAAYGLNFRMSWEPWHIEPTGARDVIASGMVTASGSGLGARTAMPSQADIAAGLDGIANPMLRQATAERLRSIMAIREAEATAAMNALKTGAFAAIDGGANPDTLPAEIRAQLGRTEMAGLWEYYEKRAKNDLKTDERVLFDLQTMYAQDPSMFSKTDLWQYRNSLSDSDWDTVNGWRQTALTDQRRAGEEASSIGSAMTFARTQLDAVGITTTGQTGRAREEAAAREMQFQMALSREMEAFRSREGRVPSQIDIQDMVARLLVPVIIEEPGRIWGTRQTEGQFFFEAGRLGNIGGGRSVSVGYEYKQIPPADRVEIEVALEQQLGRKPSEAQVEAAYENYMTSRLEN